jgi:ubiquinone/menaquinone biosynthesis C-methylase UbiE
MPRIKPEEFKEWNERMITKYDPDAFHRHSNPLIQFVEKKRVRTIFELLDIQSDDSILEVGCGAANVIERASRGRLFGVDLSAAILTKAKKQLRQEIHLFQADAQSLPCKNRVFQQVICSEVLEHLLDPSSALIEISRILATGGKAVISVPNEVWINRIKWILIRLRLFRWLMDRNGGYHEVPERMDEEWHLHSFPLEGWLQILQKFFKVARLKRIPFVWLPLRFVILLEKPDIPA